MVTVRFKLITILFALFIAFVLVNSANAFTISTDTIAWYGPGDDTGYIYCDSNTLSPTDLSTCETILGNFQNALPGLEINATSPTGDNDVISGPGTPYLFVSTATVSGDLRVYITGSGGYPITAPAYEATYLLESNTPPVTPPGNNETWGNDGLWGPTVTTESVKDDLVASVQATGTNLWPMLIFLGVVLAFAIFGYLITSINTSVKPKTARRRSKTIDMDKFNAKADELQEFYSKRGGASDEIVEAIKKSSKN